MVRCNERPLRPDGRGARTWTPASYVYAAGSDTLYWLRNTGLLYRSAQGVDRYRTQEDTNVTSLALAQDGTLYWLQNTGVLYRSAQSLDR
jgi:hypothetical protein